MSFCCSHVIFFSSFFSVAYTLLRCDISAGLFLIWCGYILSAFFVCLFILTLPLLRSSLLNFIPHLLHNAESIKCGSRYHLKKKHASWLKYTLFLFYETCLAFIAPDASSLCTHNFRSRPAVFFLTFHMGLFLFVFSGDALFSDTIDQQLFSTFLLFEIHSLHFSRSRCVARCRTFFHSSVFSLFFFLM